MKAKRNLKYKGDIITDNIKIIADLHTHTLVSNHAFNTITEMLTRAKSLGLAAMAVTDHAPAMPDSPHPWYFYTLSRMPRVIDGVVLLRGTEANVMDDTGKLDFSTKEFENFAFDWVIASIHHDVFGSRPSKQEATRTWQNVALNPYVDMIGHSEQYSSDFDVIVKAMQEGNKVIEINGNSALVRPGTQENMRALIKACRDNNALISANSDAHSIYNLADISTVQELLAEVDYPEELIINTTKERLHSVLSAHGKAAADYLR